MARIIKTTLLALLIAPLLAAPAGLQAQQPVERIAAVVNDGVISSSDVVARLRLGLLSAGLQPTEENQQRLLPQVLRGLIDERLQRQEAERLNIKPTDQQIDQAIGTIAAQNNLQREQLLETLRQNGIPVSTLREQVAAQIAWGELVQRRLASRANISQEEIDEAVRRIEQNRGLPEYLAAEIYLDVPEPSQEAEVRRLAESLVQQIRAGAPFASVARQFSQAAGAASGGDLGWVTAGQLDPVLDQALQRLSPGQVSDPIRTITGYSILLLRDQRRTAASGRGETIVTLHQIGLPFPPGGADAATRERLISTMREALAGVDGCEAFDRQAAALGAAENVDSGTGPVGNLPAPVQEIIRDLPVGQASEPEVASDGVISFMVCDRQENASGIDREQVARNLRLERLDMLQRRYMRDLRKAAYIDVRL